MTPEHKIYTLITNQKNQIIEFNKSIADVVDIKIITLNCTKIDELLPNLQLHVPHQYLSVNEKRYEIHTCSLCDGIVYNLYDLSTVKSIYDCQTKLYNKDFFKYEVSRAIALSKRNPFYKFAIMMMDIDDFKHINDEYGHIVGDIVIEEVAMRIKESVRDVDIVARFGGDEFVVLVDGIDDSNGLRLVAKRIVDSICTPIQIRGCNISVTTSIGILCSDTGKFESVKDVMENADKALYRVKRKGKNGVSFHEINTDESVLDENKYILEAIKSKKISYDYQPIVSTNSKTLVGFEILSRVISNNKDICFPSTFLKIAGINKLTTSIDINAINTAFKLIADSNYKYFVNISNSSLSKELLISLLEKNIEQHNIGSDKISNIILEINESDLASNIKRNIQWISDIREKGFGFCLDNYGDSLASLNILYGTDVNYIKINTSLINRIKKHKHGDAIVKNLTSTASILDITTIGTGIETEEQMTCMISLGCKYLQGYMIKEPKKTTNAGKLHLN